MFFVISSTMIICRLQVTTLSGVQLCERTVYGQTHSRQCCNQGCVWSRSRRLGLETVSRRTNVSSRSRLEKNCQRLGLGGRRLGLVSVSANYVSCPRPIFGQIVQATVRSVNGL